MSFLQLLKLLNGASPLFCREEQKTGDDGKGGAGGGGSGGDDNKTSLIDAQKIIDDTKKEKEGQETPEAKAAREAAEAAAKGKGDEEVKRPDWLPEKYWDPEKKAARLEEMSKSMLELEKKFSNGDHKAPAKPEDYKVVLTDEQKTVLLGKADGNPGDDPAIKALLNWGVKHKASQDAINELLGEYVKVVGPELEKQTIDIAAEKTKLGANGEALITEQMNFLQHLYKTGHINEAHLKELSIIAETAAGIQALAAVRSYYGEKPIPTTSQHADGMPSKDELSAMLNSDKYATDPEEKARVDGLYNKRYGTQPAMSSAQNR